MNVTDRVENEKIVWDDFFFFKITNPHLYEGMSLHIFFVTFYFPIVLLYACAREFRDFDTHAGKQKIRKKNMRNN